MSVSPLTLYRYSFDKRVRMGADNPTIADMARVKCPPELVELTQVQRADDPDTYEIMEENRPSAYQGRSRVSPRRSVPICDDIHIFGEYVHFPKNVLASRQK